ncbi:5'/3'-nucleotidase SurE [Anabaena cylindrica FACHB-243]|uniref:5'-nucleotidase n=1 Tax=Anabaena cylindrica (strain ATCC 27899 / PCC 7122) TaxID=272123 RepID=K9ZDD1_ANACC|nr:MULTISPECIES: 5'/3'-nucleotidase SurE [Anabaena]AFZ56385.1 stationary-phase survival protein SurE [Anabaena cylindrica PCC 7122]MBD2418167.1 5'/3'-nucleotidase SurE [Anabaena cylindrica FACHB-243]MBY5282011.1 5'/3'-nucleotidase SurE [Anabaena sp. CCAP 1446/1C]MBY5309283.1 5'/3'-nucleotidase SurE [Anabaena sp. CCAP 1446/1C]MCM2409111.1 5'/3'-nucleotidase SurE [Anabaena sp. CCAP 1446/1C]
MTIILTNDDGIDAPGIQALLKAVKGKNVIIAAPQEHQSGCGHQVTTTSPINLQRRSEVEYAINGTPADCVRIAITQIDKNVKYVLSGINAGGNLGVDAYISGTVAAVREAAMHGIPGIAISQYRKAKLNYDWELAAKWTSAILADLLPRPLEPGSFWNVNLPHLLPDSPDPEVIFCQPCTKPLPVNYRIEGDNFYYVGEYGKRSRTLGSDVDVCFSGNIAITQLKV